MPDASPGGCTSIHATIQAAVDAAGAGDTVKIASGTYNESIVLASGFSTSNLTISGDSTARPVVTGGVRLLQTATISGLTFENLVFQGVASGGSGVFDMDNTGVVNDFTLNNCVIDGGDVSGRHGFLGQNLAQSFTMTNNEFMDILSWALMDINSGSGDGGNSQTFTTVTFSNNSIHDSNGSVALRGNKTTKTTLVNANNNTWNNIGGNNSEQGSQWAALEINHAVQANVEDNTVNGVNQGAGGEGQAFQFWDITTLNVTDNTLTNNYEGIFIFGGAFGGGPWPVPGGSIDFNNIQGNSQFGLKLDTDATGGTSLDARNNFWGDNSGPSGGATDPVTSATASGAGDAIVASNNNVRFDPFTSSSVTETVTQSLSAGGGTVDAGGVIGGGSSVTVNGGVGTTVTVAKFSGSPAGTPSFSAKGFFDVHLNDITGITSVVIDFCPAAPGDVIHFWDGSSWKAVSNQAFIAPNCIRVTVTASTFPTLNDLAGQFFGLGGGVTGGDPPIWGNIMAFPTPESALGQDLDGDGDTLDTVLRYKHLDSGEVTNTGLQVSNRHRDVDMYEDTIVFVEQTQYPAGIIFTYNVKTGRVKQTGVIGVRPTIHGDRIAISGSTVRYYDLQRNKLIDTGIPGTGLAIWGNIIAFQRQVHKDFSPTIRYYNIDTGKVINTKVAGYEPVLYERRIAFTTAENLIAQDLNGDGDINDKVIRFYDIDTGKVTNTGQVGRYPSIYGQRIVYSANKEVHYYDVDTQAAYNTQQLGTEPDIYEDTISYYVWEEWLTKDLNGDADRQDPIVRTYKISSHDHLVSTAKTESGQRPLSLAPLSISSLSSYPNPVQRGSEVRFVVQGEGIKALNVEIYDLSGATVYESGFHNGNALNWNLLRDDGHALANGVYLYVMTIRGFDDQIIRSQVKKLVVLR